MKMRIARFSILCVLLSLLLLFAVACTPSRVPVEEATLPAGGEIEATEEVAPTEEGEATPEQPELTEVPTTESGVPADVPIMEGAYNLQVARGGNNIVYQVDASVDEVVTFYQEELPKYGWNTTRNPDTAVGSTALMLRENDAGDRINLNMQYNPIGDFVRLTITIARAQR